jgi:radical SAM protein with 4Fe4S-binding SPASM domain
MSDFVYVDPSTIRKNTIVRDKLRLIDGVPVFSIVEFNIAGLCNRSCTFCPVSDTSFYVKKNEFIDLQLYSKIMDDLKKINYAGKLLFSAFSEPLLHKGVFDLIRISREKLPESRIEIVSNGDVLNLERLKKLFEAGLDTISLSLYDGPFQVEKFTEMRQAAGLGEKHVVLRRRYFDDGNYGMTISNRTGLVDSNQYRDEHENKINELPLKEACYYPFYMTLIDYNGDMLLCPHDWRKTKKIGNLAAEDFWDLWQNKYLSAVRKMLAAENRSFAPCKTCDVRGRVIGQDSFDAWIRKGL